MKKLAIIAAVVAVLSLVVVSSVSADPCLPTGCGTTDSVYSGK